MVRHVVMFWLKDKVRIDETVAILESMRGKIPGMLQIQAGKDFTHTDRSCDICLNTAFESREALDVYQTHPVHMPVRAHMHSVMERSASADFEVSEL